MKNATKPICPRLRGPNITIEQRNEMGRMYEAGMHLNKIAGKFDLQSSNAVKNHLKALGVWVTWGKKRPACLTKLPEDLEPAPLTGEQGFEAAIGAARYQDVPAAALRTHHAQPKVYAPAFSSCRTLGGVGEACG